MKKIILSLAAMLMVCGCAASGPEQPESAAVEAAQPSATETPVQYETLPEAWIELVSVPFGDGTVCFGFAELPDTAGSYTHPEGAFYVGPVVYKGFLYLLDGSGNPLTKYEMDLSGYYDGISYHAHLSGDLLFLRNDHNIYRINLSDGAYEHCNGMVYTDNGAVITSLFTTQFDESDLSGEIQIDVWVDGRIVHTYPVPVEIQDYDLYGAAPHPEYLPEQDTLIFYDPAHQYTITLSTGAVESEYHFPTPPKEILSSSADRRYSISYVIYDPMGAGAYYYCYDSQTGKSSPLIAAFRTLLNVSQNYAIFTDADSGLVFDLNTGTSFPVRFPEQDVGDMIGAAYHETSGRWVRALTPNLYAQAQEVRQSATIRLEISDGNGEVLDWVDTPFHIYYGKMEANEILLDIWGNQAVMLEWNPENNLQVLSIALADLETGECSRLDGDLFCVYADSLYIAQYIDGDADSGADSILVRQYRDSGLVAEKTTAYNQRIGRLCFDPQSKEVVGCSSAYQEQFRLSLEETAPGL